VWHWFKMLATFGTAGLDREAGMEMESDRKNTRCAGWLVG